MVKESYHYGKTLKNINVFKIFKKNIEQFFRLTARNCTAIKKNKIDI